MHKSSIPESTTLKMNDKFYTLDNKNNFFEDSLEGHLDIYAGILPKIITNTIKELPIEEANEIITEIANFSTSYLSHIGEGLSIMENTSESEPFIQLVQ